MILNDVVETLMIEEMRKKWRRKKKNENKKNILPVSLFILTLLSLPNSYFYSESIAALY